MYRRPKFLEVLLEIRREMARDADYDVDLFAELVRSGDWHQMRTSTAVRSEGHKSGDASAADAETFEMRA